MVLEEHLSQAPGGHQKRTELLGEDVAVADVEPRVGGHFVFGMDGLGNPAETAIGEQTKLVVVVEDDPPMPGDTEVLEQHVAGEDVGGGQVANGVAVSDDSAFRGFGRSAGKKHVEWLYLTLGVQVTDDDPVAIHLHRSPGVALQLGQEVRRKPLLLELEVFEFLGVGQPANAVMDEYQLILVAHGSAGGPLGSAEPVADHLEYHLQRRVTEHVHNQPGFALGGLEA